MTDKISLSNIGKKICPLCEKRTLRFIDECESNKGEEKTSWTCDCSDNVIYIVRFV